MVILSEHVWEICKSADIAGVVKQEGKFGGRLWGENKRGHRNCEKGGLLRFFMLLIINLPRRVVTFIMYHSVNVNKKILIDS